MWLIIKKAGYARNFADWGSRQQKVSGLFGPRVVLGFFYGLIQMREWFLPSLAES